jgi:hypothetical protein
MPFYTPPPNMQFGALQATQPPVMDTRAMMPLQTQQGQQAALSAPRAAYEQYVQRLQQMQPNKPGIANTIGSALLPALVGAMAGGSARDALLYGVGSAAFNYQNQKAVTQNIDKAIAEAGLQLPQAEADYVWRMSRGSRIGSTPADLQMIQFLESRGYEYGTDEFDKAWSRLKSSGVRLENDQFGNILAIGSDRVPVVVGQGMKSDTGLRREAQGEGWKQGAATAADIGVRTSPGAIAAQAELEGAISGGKQAEQEKVTALNFYADTVMSGQQALAALDSAISKVESGPETGPASQFLSILATDLQVLKSTLNDTALNKVQEAKAKGLAAPNSDAELEFVRSTGGMLTNSKEANLKILRNSRSRLEAVTGQFRQAYQGLESSKYKPLPAEYAPKTKPKVKAVRPAP